MNIGLIICCFMCVAFGLLAVLFGCLKGKAAMLISGFNTMPKEKRECYDTERMSRDSRNDFILWAIIFAVGAILCILVSSKVAFLAFVVWLIFFFREVHLDEDRAFGKYKRSK